MPIIIGELSEEEAIAFRLRVEEQLRTYHEPLRRWFFYTASQERHAKLAIGFSEFGPPDTDLARVEDPDALRDLDLKYAEAILAMYTKKQRKAIDAIYNAMVK